MITSLDLQFPKFIHSNYVHIQMYLDTAFKYVSEVSHYTVQAIKYKMFPECYWLVTVVVVIGLMDGWVPTWALNLSCNQQL